MKILHITPEIAPFAKVGGLGDVVIGLSKEFVKMGHCISIMLPKYPFLATQHDELGIKYDREFSAIIDGRKRKIHLWHTTLQKVHVYFLEVEHEHFFQNGIYGGAREKESFLLFSKAALALIIQWNFSLDALHLHDWATAPVALLKCLGIDLPILLTIHNLQYQGHCSAELFRRFFDRNMQTEPDAAIVNLLELGVRYCNALNTVSPTYAKEIMTSQYGYGMENTLRKYQSKLHGILNGIDYDYWNPTNDFYLKKNYPLFPLKHLLEGKKKNRFDLSKQLGLEVDLGTPLFACISRMVYQKAPQLIVHAIHHVIDHGGQFILLGSEPEPQYQQLFDALQDKLAKHQHGHLHFTYNEALAHAIYAAADFLLIPSIFEPCGLTQLIGMRYGTIPIVRKTGGLKDSIKDMFNGLVFTDPSVEEIEKVINRAFTVYHHPREMHEIIEAGCNMDFSWEASAKKYETLYQTL